MLRIHFTAADLAAVRVAGGWGPFAETVYSIDALRNGRPSAMFGGWRSGSRQLGGPRARMLAELLPHADGLDLVSMVGESESLDDALDRLLSAPRHLMEIETKAATRYHRLPSWAAGLYDRGGQTRAQLASALAAHHRRFVQPHWQGIASRLDAERSRLARDLAAHGLGRVLSTLHPSIRWCPPTLEIHFRGADLECHLHGRGLLIIPSIFCPPAFPGVHDALDPTKPYALFYPVLRDPADALSVWRSSAGADQALTALLGRTRATILQAIGDGPLTTTELASRAAVSIPSASQHATTLRQAALITTLREHGAALHTLTPLGKNLLNN